MKSVKNVGPPEVVLGVVRQPGEVFDCEDDIAADLCRSGRSYELVEEKAKGVKSDAARP